MDKKTGIILRDILLETLKTYREDNNEKDWLNDLFSEEITKSKEGFLVSPEVSPALFNVKDPDIFEEYFATKYAEEMCSLIPDASARATKLLSILSKKRMDGVAERYLEEAIRCYIYGFFLASSAICRGSIEYSLKKYLDKDKIRKPRPIFYQLTDEACKRGQINNEDMDALNKMYKAESDCIHGKKQIESDECLEYLNLTKSVISKLL